MTQVVRDSAQVRAPKIYGYYDNLPNAINAEVVLLEIVCAFSCRHNTVLQLNQLRPLFSFVYRSPENRLKRFGLHSPSHKSPRFVTA